MKSGNKIVLTLETAINGGSIALFRGKEIIETVAGAESISTRAEDLLVQIENILNKNRIPKEALGKIIFSEGPGSLTGLRIGEATARGLGSALNIEVEKKSLLESLVLLSGKIGTVGGFLSSQKGNVFYFGEYKIGENQELQVIAGSKQIKVEKGVQEIMELVERLDYACFLGDVEKTLEGNLKKKDRLEDPKFQFINKNPAQILGECLVVASDNDKIA